MKIRDAKQAYSAQLDVLRNKRQSLTKLLREQDNSGQEMSSVDRLDLMRELSKVDAQYKATQGVMEG